MCNFVDTIEGVLFINLIIYGLNTYFNGFIDQSDYRSIFLGLSWSLRALEISTLVFDGIELSGYFQGLMAHLDGFNFGLVSAKWLKILG